MGQNQWDPILVGLGEFTTRLRTYFSGWSGMFTGGTIWILTHGQICAQRHLQSTELPPAD